MCQNGTLEEIGKNMNRKNKKQGHKILKKKEQYKLNPYGIKNGIHMFAKRGYYCYGTGDNGTNSLKIGMSHLERNVWSR